MKVIVLLVSSYLIRRSWLRFFGNKSTSSPKVSCTRNLYAISFSVNPVDVIELLRYA